MSASCRLTMLLRGEEEGAERGGPLLICILFIGSSIETAVKPSGFTFQGYPLNLDVCK